MKNKIILVLICLSALISFQIKAQIAVNNSGAAADSSTVLDINSANKGLLIPRVSISSVTDNSTITKPATSLLVYNTNASLPNGKGYYFNNGTSSAPVWQKLASVDTSGNIQSISSSGEVVKLQRFPMGEISMYENATGTTCPLNTFVKVKGSTTLSTGAYQFIMDSSNSVRYTGTSMKMFHVACTFSAISSGSNTVIQAKLYKCTSANRTGTALNAGTVELKLNASGDYSSTAIHVMVDLGQNEWLELRVMQSSSSSVTLTVPYMNMFAMGVSMGMD